MICPLCKELGLKSRITVGPTARNALHYPSYYDENGAFHHNNQSAYTTPYTCSNGHKFFISRYDKETNNGPENLP